LFCSHLNLSSAHLNYFLLKEIKKALFKGIQKNPFEEDGVDRVATSSWSVTTPTQYPVT
jgi:hypothetical protein